MQQKEFEEIKNQADFERIFFEKFQQFLERDSFAGTYKFIFIKSLFYLSGIKNSNVNIDWGKKWIHIHNEKLIVDLEFIAVPFTKYYWDMFFKYRLKQSASKNQYYVCKDCDLKQPLLKFMKGVTQCKKCNSYNLKNIDEGVNIHKNFKNQNNEALKPPKYIEEIAKNDDLIKTIIYGDRKKRINSSLNEVLYALNKKGFYNEISNFTTRNNLPKNVTQLEFDVRIVDLFNKFRIPLENAINFQLTKYLEGINKSPKIAEKILLRNKRPKLKSHEIKQMWKYNPNEDRCFYCNKSSESTFAIDHVVPFDYVLDTDLFNSVPACTHCNSSKSNHLPDYDTHFKDVLKRNEEMNLEFYVKENFERLYKDCQREYHGNDPFFIVIN